MIVKRNITSTPNLEGASQESLLLDRLYAIEDNRAGFYCVHIRLSELRPINRKPHYIKIATRAFSIVVDNYNATLFEFSNCDLFLLCMEAPIEDVDPSIAKVRALFSEDPLTATAEGSLDDIFATWYDLAQDEDYENLIALVTELAAQADEAKRKMDAGKDIENFRQMSGIALDPSNLSEITKKISEIQISDLILVQSAIHIKPKANGEILFREHFVSMNGLRERVAKDVNLFASAWLFQYLLENLDRRVLAIVGRRDFDALDAPISLNLNISTTLSKEFQKFHQAIEKNASKVIIEMQMFDICSDMGAFFYARDMLKERGYRILVDGLNLLSIQYFKPAALKADFIKVGWGREFYSGAPGFNKEEMQEIIDRTDRHKIIIARIDTEKAIEWALIFGISRFQGHYIDTIVEAMRAKGII